MKKIIAYIITAALVLSYMIVPASAKTAEISNFLCIPGNDAVTLSWKNLDTSPVGRIDLFNSSNQRIVSSAQNAASGVIVEGGTRLSKEADAYNRVTVTGLESGKEYTFTIRILKSDGSPAVEVPATVKTGENSQAVNGWNKSTSGNMYVSASATDEEAYAGDGALLIQSNTDREFSECSLIPELTEELVMGEEYSLSFYSKGVGNRGFSFGADEMTEVEADSFDWTKYECNFTYNGESPKINIYAPIDKLFIDYVSLNGRNGKNLIKNYSFEGEAASSDDEEIDYTKPVKPINFMAVGRDKSLTVSWINPKRDDIEKINLYNADGEMIKSSDAGELSKASEAANYTLVSKLENGKQYLYSLEIIFKNGEKCITECISNTLNDLGTMTYNAPTDVQTPTGWAGAVNTAPYTKYELSGDTAYEGDASLHVINNLSSALSGTYQRLGPKLTEAIEAGVKYRFTYWVKVLSTKEYSVNYSTESDANTTENGEWTQKVFEFTGKEGSTAVYFKFDRQTDIYIDDCTLYRLDDEGNTVGENLAENGSFEEGFSKTKPSDVTTAEYRVSNGIAAISWTGAGQNKIHIYNKRGDDLILRKIVAAGETGVSFVGAAANVCVIKTVSASGVESDGKEISFVPDDYEVSDVKITRDGIEISEPASGEIQAEVVVKNNNMGDGFNAVMLLCIYSNNTMTAMKSARASVPQTEYTASGVKLRAKVTADGNTDLIKVYLWDTTARRYTLSNCITLK